VGRRTDCGPAICPSSGADAWFPSVSWSRGLVLVRALDAQTARRPSLGIEYLIQNTSEALRLNWPAVRRGRCQL